MTGKRIRPEEFKTVRTVGDVRRHGEAASRRLIARLSARTKQMSDGKLMRAMSWATYPFVIFFGLRVMEPRYVAMLLALSLLLRRRADARQLARGLSRADRAVLVGLLLLAGATALCNSELLLRL